MANSPRMRDYFMRTDRLGFGTWTAGDGGLAARLWGNAEVTRYLCAGGVFSEAEIAARLQTEINNGLVHGMQYWPIFWLDTAEMAGCCGLRPFYVDKRVAEFGVHLLPTVWGKGVADEAGCAVIGHAFGALGMDGVYAGHHPDNGASRRVLARLGFVYMRDSFYEPTGRMHPLYRHAMGKGEKPEPQGAKE